MSEHRCPIDWLFSPLTAETLARMRAEAVPVRAPSLKKRATTKGAVLVSCSWCDTTFERMRRGVKARNWCSDSCKQLGYRRRKGAA